MEGARNFADWVVQTENTLQNLGHEVCEPNSERSRGLAQSKPAGKVDCDYQF
jgi:hypothetical protein